MILYQDTLQQKKTVATRLAQPMEGKVLLYPSEGQRKRKTNGE
jgi:hypothetical protein